MAYTFTQYLAAVRDSLTESATPAADDLVRQWRTTAAQLERDHEPQIHPAAQVYDDCAEALQHAIERGFPSDTIVSLVQQWTDAASTASDEEREAYDSCATDLRDLTSD